MIHIKEIPDDTNSVSNMKTHQVVNYFFPPPTPSTPEPDRPKKKSLRIVKIVSIFVILCMFINPPILSWILNTGSNNTIHSYIRCVIIITILLMVIFGCNYATPN